MESIKCSQCKRSWEAAEQQQDAIYKVKGRIWPSSGNRMIPYQAYLCEDHLEILSYDGAEWKSVINLITQRKNYLTRKLTGYNSFNELKANRPTLRPMYDEEIAELRGYYKEVTGQDAFA